MAYAEALTGTDIDFGKALWQALRENEKFPAKGAFWLFKPKSDNWHLVIATPLVEEIGPRNPYEVLLEIMRSIPVDSTQLQRISLISPKERLYQELRSVFGKTASVEGARLGNTQIGGMFIHDAYLYEIR